MSHHIIEVKDLSFSYPDGTRALESVSFRITHGEAVALLGPNGSGKSTLLLLMTGLLRPSAGSVDIGGLVVSPKTATLVRRRTGLLLQNPDDQLFLPTVLEDVLFGPLSLGLPPEEAERWASEALTAAGIAHLRDRPIRRLSQGEKKRAAIASVLATKPDILLLDEPTAALDPSGRRAVLSILAGFSHSRLIATHDLDLAERLCPRSLVLKTGRLVADAPTHELLRDRAFLETNGLA